jgi:hypothetical protein
MIIILFLRLFMFVLAAWVVLDLFVPLFTDKEPFWIVKSVFRGKGKSKTPDGKNLRSNL